MQGTAAAQQASVSSSIPIDSPPLRLGPLPGAKLYAQRRVVKLKAHTTAQGKEYMMDEATGGGS